MAIIRCKECGEEISSNAAECPHCGCPLKKTNKSNNGCEVAVTIVIAILIFFGICISFTVGNLETLSNETDFEETVSTEEIISTNTTETEEVTSTTSNEISEEEFKESCVNYTYEELARNPDNVEGKNVTVTGEVIQAVYNNNFFTNNVELRVNITKEDSSYYTYYTDTIYVVYYPKDGENKILEDDIITIYGVSQGDYTYTSVLGSSVTLPYLNAVYIEINEN